jgi:hypothetical protein
VVAGALPPGLSLNAATGVLSGTPTQAGNFSFTIVVTDANLCSSPQGSYTLAIARAGGDGCGLTICFRSSGFFLLNCGNHNIPNGVVLIGGVNGGNPVRTTDPRVQLALDGVFGPLNREWVAAQLNVLSASGMGAPNVVTAMQSSLRCYGLDFDPVTVGGTQQFTPETTLFTLFNYLNSAIKSGVSARDACVLTKLLNNLNGNNLLSVCHRATAKFDFSGCN